MDCYCDNNIQMILGEKRMVGLSITAANQSAFPVTNATYQLVRGEEIEDSGNCTVTEVSQREKRLDIYIEPEQATNYQLIFSYEIGDEKLKTVVYVYVTEA